MKSEKFILILRLCRYRNQILYCHKGFLDYALVTTPIGIRQRFNSIYFLCAVLNEAERVIPELGKEFRHFRSYQNGFASFLRNSKLTSLRKKLFTPLRNQLVSHVDNVAIANSLSTFDVDTYEFLSVSHGIDVNSLFFDLADDVVLNAFVESDSDHSSKKWPFEELFADVLAYSSHYSRCADDLIKEYLSRKGWPTVEDSAYYEQEGVYRHESEALIKHLDTNGFEN